MTGDVASAWAVRLSVPGKVILMGEHAAVYGRPAVVAAVGRRLVVEGDLRPAAGDTAHGRVRLDLSDLGLREEHSWGAIDEFTGRARRWWHAFRRGEASLRPADELSALARIAVGEEVASSRSP